MPRVLRSYVTVTVVDADGTPLPDARVDVQFAARPAPKHRVLVCTRSSTAQRALLNFFLNALVGLDQSIARVKRAFKSVAWGRRQTGEKGARHPPVPPRAPAGQRRRRARGGGLGRPYGRLFLPRGARGEPLFFFLRFHPMRTCAGEPRGTTRIQVVAGESIPGANTQHFCFNEGRPSVLGMGARSSDRVGGGCGYPGAQAHDLAGYGRGHPAADHQHRRLHHAHGPCRPHSPPPLASYPLLLTCVYEASLVPGHASR